MNGSDETLMNTGSRRPAGWKSGLASLGFLALGFTACLPAPAAQAQFFSWWWSHDDGPPPLPPGEVGEARPADVEPVDVGPRVIGPRDLSPRDVEPEDAAPPIAGPREAHQEMLQARAIDPLSGVVPVAELRRRAGLLGLRLLATPHRKGPLYLAFAEDAHGLRHRLAFDAYQGIIIENLTFGAMAKTALARPGELPHGSLPSEAIKTPATPDKAASAPSAPTVTAKEIPAAVKPIASVKPSSHPPLLTPQDPDIDKD